MTRQQWQNGAHAVLAVGSAVAFAVTGIAFGAATVLGEFGVHVSGMDIAGKSTAVSGGILIVSKLIDSANNALGGTPASSAPASATHNNAPTATHAPFVPTPVPPSPGT